MLIEKRFTVADTAYKLLFENDEFLLFIDVLNSKNPRRFMDEGFGFSFFDTYPEFISSSQKSEKPFEVLRICRDFIEEIVSKVKPKHFSFSTHEPKKFSLYRRYSERLANKFGYYCSVEVGAFRFYKIE